MFQLFCGTLPEYSDKHVNIMYMSSLVAVIMCMVYAYAPASCCLTHNAVMTSTAQVTEVTRSILMSHTGVLQLLCAIYTTVLTDKVHSDVTHRCFTVTVCQLHYCTD